MLGPGLWWCVIPCTVFKALDENHADSSSQHVKLTLLTGADLLAVPLWIPGMYSAFWGWAPVPPEALPHAVR